MKLYMDMPSTICTYLSLSSTKDVYAYSIDKYFINIVSHYKFYERDEIDISQIIKGAAYKKACIYAPANASANPFQVKARRAWIFGPSIYRSISTFSMIHSFWKPSSATSPL